LIGDIYNGKSTIDSRNIVKERMKSLAKVAPVLICYGNHDYANDLEILGDLRSDNPIKIYNTISTVQYDDCMIYAVPWIDKSRWLQINPEYDISSANSSVSALLLKYISHLRGKSVLTKNILFGHILISGAKAENMQPLIGEGVTIGEYDLKDIGFDMSALGHIHLKQTFADGKTFYNGSPAAMDFGEQFEKWFSIYDTQSSQLEWYKIPAIKRMTITGRFKEGSWEQTSEVESEMRGARLRISYNISVTEDQNLARETISNAYSIYNPLEIKMNPIIQIQTRTRAESVSEANTLKDKLIEYWKATETTPEQEEMEGILKKLKTAEGLCSTGNLEFKA
jgi:DNA repair exonuclease SbcCD nuclease subunit